MRAFAPALVLGLAACFSKPPPPGDGGGGGGDGGGGGGGMAFGDVVAVGGEHACLLSGSDVYCWGDNREREAGGSDDAVTAPVKRPHTGYTALAAGREHSCGIAGGIVYCWGRNDLGQCDPQEEQDHVADAQVALPAAAGAPLKVFAGGDGTCVVDDQTQVFCWGAVDDKYIGDDPQATSAAVVQIMPGGIGKGWADVALTDDHACVRSAEAGAVACWGADDNAQLGGSGTHGYVTPSAAISQLGSDGGGTLENLADLTVTDAATCGVRAADHAIVCWGEDSQGRFDRDASPKEIVPPATVPGDHAWAHVRLGDHHACAMDSSGDVYCWGDDDTGACGAGLDAPGGTLTPAILTTSGAPGALAVGDSFSCAIGSDHQVSCWGANTFGQLGLGYVTTQRTPAQVAGAGNAAMLAVGRDHTCIVTTDGDTHCWGRDNLSQITSAGSAFQLIPTAADTALPGPGTIVAGASHTCEQVGSAARCWGRNDEGQLGGGDNGTHQVDQPWTTVAASGYTTCGFGAGDTGLSCFGSSPSPTGTIAGATWPWLAVNGNEVAGTPGIGSATFYIGHDRAYGDASSPAQVVAAPGSSETAAVYAAGESHACALLTISGQDELHCWGANDSHQLGDDTGDHQERVVDPPAGQEWSGGSGALALATDHTCVLAAGGAIYCVGDNENGALSTIDGSELAAIPPPAGLTWIYVATGDRDTCAIASDRSVWCWGYNEYGEAGNGRTFSGTPQPVLAPR